jgi:hypothetical protein
MASQKKTKKMSEIFPVAKGHIIADSYTFTIHDLVFQIYTGG